MRSRVLASLVLLGVWLICPEYVSAHAELLGSDPPMSSSLDEPPSELRLYFSEPVAAGMTDLSLLDARGRRVDRVVGRIDTETGRVLSAPVENLQPGVYTISYRALSAIDGHIDRGVVTFAFGTSESATGLGVTEVLRQPSLWIGAALRLVGYIAALFLVGIPAFRVFAVGPVRPSLTSQQRVAVDSRLTRLVFWSSLLFACSSLALLIQQAVELADEASLSSILASAENLVVRTRYGAFWLGRMALGAAVFGVLRYQQRLAESERAQRWGGAVILAGLALYTFASLSHASSAMDGSWVGVGLSWLHLVAIGLWLGAAVGLVLAASTGAALVLAGPVARMALGSFVAIVLSGFGQTLVLVGDPRALIETLPGQLLLAKLITVTAIVAIAWQARRLVHAHRARTIDSVAAVVRRTRLEIGLAALALGVTAVLVYLPPAWQTYQQQLRARPIETRTVVGDLNWLTRIDPGRPGENTIVLQPPDELRGRIVSARVLATFQDDDFPPSGARLDPDESGALVVRGPMLSMAGGWLLESVVRLDSGEDLLVRAPLSLVGPGTPVLPPPVLRGGALTASVMVALGLIGLGLGMFAFVVKSLGTRSGEARGLIAATAAIVLLGGYVAVRPTPSEAVTTLNVRRSVNPISATEQSVVRGRETYERACAECHGRDGRGDGARVAESGGRLTDLRVHLSAGHSDGDLYFWISNGINGTEMPGFANELSDDDRWHLVNAIRAITAEPRL